MRKRGICRDAEHLNPGFTKQVQYALAYLCSSILIVLCCVTMNPFQALTFGKGMQRDSSLTALETLRDQVSLELQRASVTTLLRKRQR